MAREKGRKSLRAALKEADAPLWPRLEVIWQKATAGILEAQKSPHGHQQGLSHVRAVEENLGYLIPDGWKGSVVTAIDLFLLSAAACLHDAGKAGNLPGDHGHVSSYEVRTRGQDFGLEPGEADAVGWIVSAHSDKKLDSLPSGPFPVRGGLETNLRPLAALLCLADTLVCDASRVSPQAIKMFPQAQSLAVTRFRQLVRGWIYDKEGRIVVQGTATDLTDIDIFHQGLQGICGEVEPVAAVLEASGYPHEIVASLDDSRIEYETQHKAMGERGLPGMDFYKENDAELFKGRGTETRELYQLLLSSPVCLLVGDSGMGKSSLVCAGLFPFIDKLGTWRHCWSRPFVDPTRFVVSDIVSQLGGGAAPAGQTIASTLERLAQECPSPHHVLLVLDQLEDIADGPEPLLEDLRQSLVQVLASRFPNLHVLLVYRADAQARLGPWLQRVSGSSRSLPAMYLQPLEDSGANEALRALWGAVQVGCDPPHLLDTIVADIKAQGKGLYPPFLQMVAQVLADGARRDQSVVTPGLYGSLGGAAGIVGGYLMGRLKEFGDRQGQAEQVLKVLVRSTGRKGEERFDALERATQLEANALRALLKDMVDRRLVRPLGGDRYEVVHDCFAQLVNDQLVSTGERRVKQLKELLASKAAAYAATQAPLAPSEVAQLYLVRGQIVPSEPERVLMFESCLAELGPAWYWFRDEEQDTYVSLVRRAISHPYGKVRLSSVKLLTALARKEFLPLTRQLLADPDSRVRQAAIQAIGQLGSREDLPAVRGMLKDPDWRVRQAAMQAIGQLGSREDLPALRDLLKDPDWSVRQAATQAIGQLGSREDVPALKEMLQDRNEDVRRAAFQALLHLASRGDLPALRGMLKDPETEVRWAAIHAVAQLGSREDLPALREMLNSPEGEVRWAAVHAIAQLGSREDLPALRDMLLKPSVETVRQLDMGDDPVLGTLADTHDSLRQAAIQAVAQLASREDLPALGDMLKDGYQDMRRAAIQAMARLGSREHLPALSDMLTDPDWRVRDAAIQAIGQLGSREHLPALSDMLTDPDWRVRQAAAQAVAQVGNETDLDALARLVASAPFGDKGKAANEALIELDRRLYCPFPWPEEPSE